MKRGDEPMRLPADTALSMAMGHLDGMERQGSVPLEVTHLVRHRSGWVVYFNSQKYVESQVWTDLLGGNGPIVLLDDDRSVMQVRMPEEAVELVGEAI